ncbi:PIN domain-containing protein [Candidatus Gottesmanbacteria bacterium]|nr:PIN domain-containing protein [Candidatus Gottesmanbacteria bacterium]MBI5452071.1 PIN domain-containing protein [Candidatus Gottesmanbacteria bacterium]
MILPDTNVLIAYFANHESSVMLLNEALLHKKLVFSVIAVAEFLAKANKEATTTMNHFVDEIGIKEITREIMEQAVTYRKQTLQKSKRAHLLDCFIAATAKVHKATLLTFDHRDYPFPDLSVKQPEEISL